MKRMLKNDVKVTALPLPVRGAPVALIGALACAITLAAISSQIVPLVLVA